jgi:nitronate monooxygenase
LKPGSSPIIGPLHDAGIEVFSDVASMRHVHRAIEAGVDGLVLLTAGAGGQTGWANPLAFIRAVRKEWDGPVVLAGGVADGTSLLAALVAGYDLAYMGTAFIATTESSAAQPYKQAVVTSSLDDIELTSRFTGIPTSMIRSAVEAEAPDRGRETLRRHRPDPGRPSYLLSVQRRAQCGRDTRRH